MYLKQPGIECRKYMYLLQLFKTTADEDFPQLFLAVRRSYVLVQGF